MSYLLVWVVVALCVQAVAGVPLPRSSDLLNNFAKAQLPFIPPDVVTQSNVKFDNCNGPDYSLRIETIYATSPVRGMPLTFGIRGFLTEPIERGAKATVVVRLGKSKIISRVLNFCREMRKMGSDDCPFQAGEVVAEYTAEFPDELPDGSYTVHVMVVNADKKPVGCVNASFKLD
ncbi:ML domain-containing protein [Cladochytrium replicatum]|nr:ML domain-containing protein [Cladochytrium replicatum]